MGGSGNGFKTVDSGVCDKCDDHCGDGSNGPIAEMISITHFNCLEIDCLNFVVYN